MQPHPLIIICTKIIPTGQIKLLTETHLKFPGFDTLLKYPRKIHFAGTSPAGTLVDSGWLLFLLSLFLFCLQASG